MNGWLSLFKDKKRQEFADTSPADLTMVDEDPASAEMPDAPHGFTVALRRKRRTAMMKKMLSDMGYGDLAKMINVKEY